MAYGKRLTMNRIELICELGVGAVTGQGVDPEVMISFSDNGGRTFSTERRGKIGRLGDFERKVEWHICGSFVDRIVRVSVSDPVNFVIHNMVADVEIGII